MTINRIKPALTWRLTATLKRLNESTFEFAKLFIDPNCKKLRNSNETYREMYHPLQGKRSYTTFVTDNYVNAEAHKLYYKPGFNGKKAPRQMTVLKRTEKIMEIDM